MDVFIEYLRLVLPGVAVIAALSLLLPRKAAEARILVLILGFILLRDAMTRAGLWRFGTTETIPWVRFVPDQAALWLLAGTSLVLAVVVWLTHPDLRDLLTWWGEGYGDSPGVSHVTTGLLMGLAGAGTIALPFIYLYQPVPLADRGGPVASGLVGALLGVALLGNFLEELLFRGYLQGLFDEQVGPNRALLISAVAFGAAHAFLAITVTGLGWPILAFTLWVGLVCAVVRRFSGIVPATLAHGLAIMTLASGLL